MIYTEHARMRMAQRNIPREAVEYVYMHGVPFERNGAVLYALMRQRRPQRRRCHRHRHPASYYNIGVLVKGDIVVTVYRERGRTRLRRDKETSGRSRRKALR